MVAKVCFLPSEIEKMRLYGGWEFMVRHVEDLLGNDPLFGFECFEEMPGIRAFNRCVHSPRVYPPMLGFLYVMYPFADARPDAVDEVFVIRVGPPIWRGQCEYSREELSQIMREYRAIAEICRKVDETP